MKYCAPVIESFVECTNAWNQATATETTMETTSNCCLDRRIFYLSALLYPLRNMFSVDGKGKEMSLVSFVIRESIKYPNRDTVVITTVLSFIDEIRSILLCYDPSDEATFCRLRTGLVLRNLKDLWVTALLVAAIVEMHAREQDALNSNLNGDVNENWNSDGVHQVPYFISKAFSFFELVQKHGLDGCWKVRPLLDGKAILKRVWSCPEDP